MRIVMKVIICNLLIIEINNNNDTIKYHVL